METICIDRKKEIHIWKHNDDSNHYYTIENGERKSVRKVNFLDLLYEDKVKIVRDEPKTYHYIPIYTGETQTVYMSSETKPDKRFFVSDRNKPMKDKDFLNRLYDDKADIIRVK